MTATGATVPADRDAAPTIRALDAGDLPALAGVIDATALFEGDLLSAMAAPALEGGAEGERWLVALRGDRPAGVVHFAREAMTDRCWNILLLAVAPARQGRGIGRALVAAAERRLRGERLLLVETSALPAFAGARAFYAACGYAEEARVRDFYARGEDKIVFRKVLAPA